MILIVAIAAAAFLVPNKTDNSDTKDPVLEVQEAKSKYATSDNLGGELKWVNLGYMTNFADGQIPKSCRWTGYNYGDIYMEEG